MDRPRRDAHDARAWGEALLIGLLAAALILFATYPTLRHSYDAGQARLVLETVIAVAAVVAAFLAAIRVSVEGRWSDVFLCTGFAVTGAATFAFSVVPLLNGSPPIAGPGGVAAGSRPSTGAALPPRPRSPPP